MERTLARLSVGNGNARDLIVLKESLTAVPKLKKTLESVIAGTELLIKLTAQITELPELVDLIARAIADAPPLALKEGGLIKPRLQSRSWTSSAALERTGRRGLRRCSKRKLSARGSLP